MATQTFVELETLDKDGSKLISQLPATALAGPSGASTAIAGPATHIHSIETASQHLSKSRANIVITQLAGINFITSFTNGLLTVGLPAMAAALHLPPSLLLWPSSAYALTTGSCLLLAGSFADVIGSRVVNLTGCFFIAVFVLACGFARTGIELIMFKAMQGVASALALPSAMSIVSKSVESGKRRNIGFATLGLAQPLGFSFGCVLGGVFVSTVGWRAGFYIGGGASFLLFFVGIWALPVDAKAEEVHASTWKRLATEIDWIGAVLASTAIALFSYVLAMLSANIEHIKRPVEMVLLVLSVGLAVSFVFWVRRQEQIGRPALIPNSLWKKRAFTCICLMVLLSFAVVNCMELFSSLFFQEVQHTTALGASLRILPNMLIGMVLNFGTGVFVNRLPAIYALLVANGLCSISPLLMALINPKWPYWYDAFFAQLLSPVSVDVLFTIGMLIVSDVFPTRMQALAGAVFNTLAQLGTSIGFTTMSVISVSVTKESDFRNKSSPEALMVGYRASFWTLFAWMLVACAIGVFGLRKMGRIGEKRD